MLTPTDLVTRRFKWIRSEEALSKMAALEAKDIRNYGCTAHLKPDNFQKRKRYLRVWSN